MLSRALTALTAITCAVAACSGDAASSNGGDAAGTIGSGGSAGSAGRGGSAGNGGSAGSAGRGGSAGNGGSVGNGGTAGSSGGSGGASGSAGSTGGSAGNAGSGGSAGSAPDASTSCPEGGTPDASTEDAIRAACTVAVVRVSRLDEECSGLGGTHVTFTVIAVGRGTPVTVLSHGGHGYFAPPDGPDTVGEYFVAGVDAFGRLIPRPDNGAWCITGLPDIDGQVHTLLAATSEADARAKMRGLL